MACGCSKTRKATAKLMSEDAPPRSGKSARRSPAPAPSVRTRARFASVPPRTSDETSVIFSTLFEARAHALQHGWTVETVRVPVG